MFLKRKVKNESKKCRGVPLWSPDKLNTACLASKRGRRKDTVYFSFPSPYSFKSALSRYKCPSRLPLFLLSTP
jgi:hypothetical protein